MTSENPVADRLVTDARKKSAKLESPMLAMAALVVGAIGVVSGPFVPLFGWILGAVAAVMGVIGVQRSTAAKQAKIALVVGAASILVATFFFTMAIA